MSVAGTPTVQGKRADKVLRNRDACPVMACALSVSGSPVAGAGAAGPARPLFARDKLPLFPPLLRLMGLKESNYALVPTNSRPIRSRQAECVPGSYPGTVGD